MSVLSTSKVSFPTIAARCDLEDLKDVPYEPTPSTARRSPTAIGALCRAAFLRRLARLNRGRLTMLDGSSAYEFGDRQSTDLQVTVNIRDERAYRYLVTGGSLGAAEAYLQNLWDCDDLVTFFRFMIRNTTTLREIDRRWSRFRFRFRSVAKLLQRNTKAGSRRNIASHYDLSNQFFELFLDETMTYSSGIFEHPQATLQEASVAKYDRICRTIQLSPDDHVLEIGTGWGGFAIHAARKYGCRVTTTTISKEQHEYARRRIEQNKLDDRVTLLLRDYRDLDGVFDKLVSIEMVEAVGHEFLSTYFSQCMKLLRPKGWFALQAITIGNDEYDRYRQSTDFIQRYIFPGGCLPSLATIDQAANATQRLKLMDISDFASHYAVTVAQWRDRFHRNLKTVRELGFDERFIRMWDYYLCYCEAGFREGRIGLSQFLYRKD